MSRLQALVSNVIPEAVQSGAFGSGVKLISIERDPSSKGEDQFSSNIHFLTLFLNDGGNEIKKSVLVKQQLTSKEQRDSLNTKAHFNNEVWMYERLLPMLDQGSGLTKQIFPNYYHGRSTLDNPPEDDIVIIEDLRPSGYHLTEERLFIDYEHFVIALQQLGRFHALSYRAKSRTPELFIETINCLTETTWLNKKREFLNDWLLPGIKRAVTPMLESNQYVNILEWFSELLSNPYEYMVKLVTPNKSMSVICHGDFCRNNMLFNYDSSNKPIAVKFFDLQTSRYASPAIDLTFFLYLNTTQQFRIDHWDDLLRIYHNALSATFLDITVPSFEDIRSEVVSKAVYGFIHCSYFLPMMVVKNAPVMDDLIDAAGGETLAKLGGEETTHILCEIVNHLVQINRLY